MAGKNYLRKSIILFTLITLMFTSCDSLWEIQETTSISFTIDVNEILANSTDTSSTRNNLGLRSGDELQGQAVIVSLHKDSDDSLVAEQRNPLLGNFETIQVTFENLRVGQYVYAKIIIQNEAGLIAFSARSESTRVTAKDNYLVARTNAIFLNPSANTDADNNNGLTPDTAVYSLEKATELLRKSGNYITGATVYLMDSIAISANTTWNYGTIIVKRYGKGDFPMVSTSADFFNLGGATLDGNGVGYGIDASGGLVTIQNGTITNTDEALSNFRPETIPTYNIRDMRIIGNKNGIINPILKLAGGTIIINGNSEQNVSVTPIVTANLSSYSLIGLTLSSGFTGGEQLVFTEPASGNIQINPSNFFINNHGAGEHLSVNNDGNLIYLPNAMQGSTLTVGSNAHFPSLQEAVSLISQINDGSKAYTIIVSGDISTNTVNIESAVALNLTIKGDTSNPATITSNGGVTIFNIEDLSPEAEPTDENSLGRWENNSPVHITLGEHLEITGSTNNNISAINLTNSILTVDGVHIRNSYQAVNFVNARLNIKGSTTILCHFGLIAPSSFLAKDSEMYLTDHFTGDIKFYENGFVLRKGEDYNFNQSDLDAILNGSQADSYNIPPVFYNTIQPHFTAFSDDDKITEDVSEAKCIGGPSIA